jgi:hypothetical protein
MSAVSALALPASAAPPDPAFRVSDVHYAMDSTGPTTLGLRTVSFRLRGAGPENVTAWFNASSPATAHHYACVKAGEGWTCAATSRADEEDVRGAATLHVQVSGMAAVLDGQASRHHHGSGVGYPAVDHGASAERDAVDHGQTLPFTGANLVPELVAAAALTAAGSLLLRAGRRRRRSRIA